VFQTSACGPFGSKTSKKLGLRRNLCPYFWRSSSPFCRISPSFIAPEAAVSFGTESKLSRGDWQLVSWGASHKRGRFVIGLLKMHLDRDRIMVMTCRKN